MNWKEWPKGHRKFEGKIYTLLGQRFLNKGAAMKNAAKWRRNGYNARVVEHGGKFYVYHRQGKR